MSEMKSVSWKNVEKERLSDSISRQAVYGENGTMARLFIKRGAGVARHSHANEEYSWVLSGAVKYSVDGREIELRAGDAVVIPPSEPHSAVALEDSEIALFFTPAREDWVAEEDQYLRG